MKMLTRSQVVMLAMKQTQGVANTWRRLRRIAAQRLGGTVNRLQLLHLHRRLQVLVQLLHRCERVKILLRILHGTPLDHR